MNNDITIAGCAMPSARAFVLRTTSIFVAVAVPASIAIALSGCGISTPSYESQQARGEPFVELTDNHGCRWRLMRMNTTEFAYMYPQVRPDGNRDCAAAGMEARRAAAENTDAVHDSPTAESGDAQ